MELLIFFALCFGVLAIMSLTSWLALIFLTSVFPAFNFKDEFIDYCIRTRGAAPSRRRLILSAYGACNYFFRAEQTMDTHLPNGIRIIPNRKNFRWMLLGFLTLATVILFWIAVFVGYSYLRSWV